MVERPRLLALPVALGTEAESPAASSDWHSITYHPSPKAGITVEEGLQLP